MNPKLKVYLAGPMRGLPEYNFPLFLKAATDLRLAGLEVFNPAEQDLDRGFEYEGTTGFEPLPTLGLDLREAMADDMAYISGVADAVVTLPGWEESPGASAEVALALALGLMVFEYDSVMLAYARLVEKATRPTRPWYFYNAPDDDPPDTPGAFVAEFPQKTVAEYLDVMDKVAQDLAEAIEKPHDVEALTGEKHRHVPDLWGNCYCGFNTVLDEEREPAVDYEPQDDVEYAVEDDEEPRGVNYETETIKAGDGTVVAEVRKISPSGGAKGSKPQRFDLIPVDPMWTVAEVYGKGAEKYEDRNWERGYNWSLSYAAMQRHLHQFWGGEYLDEDGLPHLAHAVFHALALLWFAEHKPEYDDRFGKSQVDLVAEEVEHLDRLQREKAGIDAGYLRLARDIGLKKADDAAA